MSEQRIWVVFQTQLDYDDYETGKNIVAVFDSKEQAEACIAGRRPGQYRGGFRAECYRLNQPENARDYHQWIY